tara:strand:+ start:206 stop:502 length:297 start_codon:yes stop_codon:yes gene_type:complete
MWFWLFLASLLIVLVLMFYIRWLLQIVKIANQDMQSLTIMISDFSEHVSSIYELEMFYGDQTLQNLLNHSKELVETLKDLDLVLNEPQENELINEKKK